ncbi:MAG: hypothetical protein KA170_02165 [Candidatus Promineofilum sp.]|nr:hypothetical protein [Promineifilum sp.]
MKQYQIAAALAAFLLSGLLMGCGGDQEPATTEEPTVVVAVAQPTKPPPIVAANTAAPAADAGQPASGDAPAGDAPALPTAIPTQAPTEAPPTEIPTETAVPTAVPPTAAPVVVPPTAAPPTATVVPPTPLPQVGANGLVASNFAIQDRAELTPNGSVWFQFTVANNTGGDVPYNAIGVMPRKGGVDRPDWYQQSYGGPDSIIKPGGLQWEDRIRLPEVGDYTLRLVVCFDGFDACLQQRGTWHALSPEVPVTIR